MSTTTRLIAALGFVLVVALCALPRSLFAEKVDMSQDQLRDTATHVLVGKITGIYERKEDGGDWKYTKFIAEVRIEKVEKGEGLHAGEIAYVRYWRRQYAGKDRNPPPATSGHRGLPQDGQRTRIFLARNAYDGFNHDNKDGGLNVIGANGFEPLPSSPAK